MTGYERYLCIPVVYTYNNINNYIYIIKWVLYYSHGHPTNGCQSKIVFNILVL